MYIMWPIRAEVTLQEDRIVTMDNADSAIYLAFFVAEEGRPIRGRCQRARLGHLRPAGA
jgi:hypothetical protein